MTDTGSLTGQGRLVVDVVVDLSAAIQNAVAALDPFTRVLFYLYYWLGWSFTEIADEFGVAEADVREAHRKGLLAVREAAGDHALLPREEPVEERQHSEEAAASLGDPLLTPCEDWEQRPLAERLRLEAQAATVALRHLRGRPPAPSRGGPSYLIVCGREADGGPRVVWTGDDFPDRGRERAAEREHGLKAWRMTTLEPGEAEEQVPDGTQGRPSATPTPGLPWAGGMRRWISHDEGESPQASPYDKYPVVRVRVSWASQSPEQAAVFTADLDTGAPHCVFPLEHLRDALGEADVLDNAVAVGYQPHLKGEWACWALNPHAFRFEVHTAGGWCVFTPRRHEACATPLVDWNDQTFYRVRTGRQAFVGRPIGRGKVKLTLESSGADWESTPPVTY